MRRSLHALSLAVAVASSATTLSAQVTIDFDALLDGTVVTNQFAGLGAVFSSSAGNVNYVTTQAAYNGTKPSFLCTGAVSSFITCLEPTYVDFSTPVGALSFQALGINNVGGTVAQARVYGGAVLLGTIDVPASAQGLNPELVSFGAISGITRLEIDNITDGAGIGWDTFTFTPGSSTVPEPSTYLLLGTGLLALGGIARRRRA